MIIECFLQIEKSKFVSVNISHELVVFKSGFLASTPFCVIQQYWKMFTYIYFKAFMHSFIQYSGQQIYLHNSLATPIWIEYAVFWNFWILNCVFLLENRDKFFFLNSSFRLMGKSQGHIEHRRYVIFNSAFLAWSNFFIIKLLIAI